MIPIMESTTDIMGNAEQMVNYLTSIDKNLSEFQGKYFTGKDSEIEKTIGNVISGINDIKKYITDYINSKQQQ